MSQSVYHAPGLNAVDELWFTAHNIDPYVLNDMYQKRLDIDDLASLLASTTMLPPVRIGIERDKRTGSLYFAQPPSWDTPKRGTVTVIAAWDTDIGAELLYVCSLNDYVSLDGCTLSVEPADILRMGGTA